MGTAITYVVATAFGPRRAQGAERSRPERLLSVQYFRGIAALSVATTHALDQVVDRAHAPYVQFLRGGVDVAFVISGFIMWYVLLRTQLSPLQFLWRRILRIVPLYWGVTSVMVLTMMAAPALLQSARFDINHVLASYVFLAWPNPVPGAALRPVLQPGWTLDLEMFFYLLVAIGLLLPRNRQQLFTGVMLAGLAAVGLCVPPGRPIAAFYANSLLIEFALGLGVALLMQHVDWLPKPVYFALIAIGLAGMVGFGNHINQAESNRLVVFGAPVAALGAGMVLFERDHGIGNSRLLKTAGDASYSIYLTHTLFISGFVQLWKRAHLAGTQPWLFVCLAALGSLLLGVLVNRLVERPLIAGLTSLQQMLAARLKAQQQYSP